MQKTSLPGKNLKISNYYGIKTAKTLCTHHLESIVERIDVNMQWDLSISTCRTIKANHPDCIVTDRTEKVFTRTDTSESGDKKTSMRMSLKFKKTKRTEDENRKKN